MEEKTKKEDLIIPSVLSLLTFLILLLLRKKGMWELSGYFAGAIFLFSPILLEKSDEVLGLKMKLRNLLIFSFFSFMFFSLLFAAAYFLSPYFEENNFLNIPFSPRTPELSDTKFFLLMLLGVALPEELFFRGFVQGKFNKFFGRKFQLLGVRFGVGLVLADLLFTLVHLAYSTEIIRFLVFFPGLIFGFLREKYGSIFPAVVFHAVSNLFMLLITSG